MISGAGRAKCKLLCEIVVLVDVGSVAGGRVLVRHTSTGSSAASPKISRSRFLEFFPFWYRTRHLAGQDVG